MPCPGWRKRGGKNRPAGSPELQEAQRKQTVAELSICKTVKTLESKCGKPANRFFRRLRYGGAMVPPLLSPHSPVAVA